jgi:impB/mucB/samB family
MEAEERAGGTSAEAGRSRKIIHIDMDAFYASVEQRDNPELRGKPVAVGGSRERGVVAAASYEARKFGVHSAMPSITAMRKCPDLIFVKPRFDAYKAISLQIREVFAEYTPIIEPLSLDEAYLDVTENRKGIISATRIAEEIRARIRAETELTASAGVSYDKFLAKLASDHRKPDTPGTWGYRAAATAAWASSTVLRWGNTRPYTPVSSACLITHWLRSRAFGGIRTIGTTSGCRLPFSAILLRFSSTCREVRRVVKLKPSCSISMMTAS